VAVPVAPAVPELPTAVLPLPAPLMPGVAAALPVAGEVALPPVAPVSELPAPVPELALVVLSPLP
jgi:hypothetical protein